MFTLTLRCILILTLVNSLSQTRAEEKPVPREWVIMAYNVENLFDVDAVSLYADFPVQGNSPAAWTAEKLARKLGTIARNLKAAGDGGHGPDILVLQELEADHTPESTAEAQRFVEAHRGENYTQMLREPLSPELRGVPAEAWLLKALADEGIEGYSVALGDVRDLSTEAIRCAVLTRLPVRAVRQHLVEQARTILEVEVEVENGTILYVFANHWKSGAGDPAMEVIRIGNAKVLRARIDQILKADANAAILIAGDLNCHHNQHQRYPYMPQTALQDVLRSQGNPSRLADGSADLYNLWYDVPAASRGSDIYRGEWGTLMQMIISRGLADGKGLEYVGGTFHRHVVPGVNSRGEGELPWAWTSYGPGAGCSDHFPVVARLRLMTSDSGPATTLRQPEPDLSNPLLCYPEPVDRTKLRSAETVAHLGPDGLAVALGELFRIEGTFRSGSRPRVRVGDVEYPVHSGDRNLLAAIKAHQDGSTVRWVGNLEFYQGRLEFQIDRPEWIKDRTPR